MQVLFNHPVTLKVGTPEEQTFGKGQHDVPDALVKDNWYFDAMVQEGNAIILRGTVKPEIVITAEEIVVEGVLTTEAVVTTTEANAEGTKETGKTGKHK